MTQTIDLGKLRFNFSGAFSPTTTYELNDVASYRSNVYCYTNALTSTGNLPTATQFWTLMIKGFAFEGVFNTATNYQVGELVKYGGTLYVSILDTQGNDPTNGTYWSPFITGINPTGVYNAGTAYVPNDIVSYGSDAYRCITNSTGNLPTNATYFTIFFSGISVKGAWVTATNYYANDIVTFGANSYISTVQHTSTVMATDITNGKWTLLTPGIRWMGAWATETAYLPNDVVTDGHSTWIANTAFTSGATIIADGIQPSANYKWAALALGAANVPAVDNTVADMVLSNNGINGVWVGRAGTIRTPVTASGTAVNFTGIPAWARKIKIIFDKVSTNSVSPKTIRIGTSAGILSTGYVGSSTSIKAAVVLTTRYMDGFTLNAILAADSMSGVVGLVCVSPETNSWVASGVLGDSLVNTTWNLGSSVTLPNVLSSVQITTVNGTDVFDTGSVNIVYS